MSLRFLRLGFVAFSAFAAAAPALACDSGLESLGGVSSVTVQFESRKPEMPLEDSGQIASIVSFFRNLGGWTEGSGAGAGDGVIRSSGSGGKTEVWLTRSGFKTDSCHRAASAGELDELYALLMASE